MKKTDQDSLTRNRLNAIKMSSKTFRGLHGAKQRSASTNFISLHFNKADEEQLEISYTDDKQSKEESKGKSLSDVSEDYFKPIVDINGKSENSSKHLNNDSPQNEESIFNKDSTVKDYWSRMSKRTSSLNLNDGLLDDIKEKFTKTVEGIKDHDLIKTCNDKKVHESNVEKNEIDSSVSVMNTLTNDCNDSLLKLSPAIEASELNNENSFDSYISNELEKATCEILDSKGNTSSFASLSQSTKSLLSEPLITNIHENPKAESTEIMTQCKSSNSLLHNKSEKGTFSNIMQRSVDFVNFSRNSVKFHIFMAILACIWAPIPSWLSGFLVGAILSSCIVYWLYKPQKSVKNFPNFNIFLQENIQTKESKQSCEIFKGWMNELPPPMSYNPDKYHVSCTRSVYVRLDGSYLRLSFPQKNIPKRAMFNEPRHELQFIYQQHYDITNAIVELLPKGLANKRLWSKKYPICLKIPNSKEAVLTNVSRLDTLDGSFPSKTTKKENIHRKFMPRINDSNQVVICLFSRTDRDKNLWFSRYVKASKMKIHRPHSPLSSRVDDMDSTLENKRAKSVDFSSLQLSSATYSEPSFFDNSDEIDSFVEISISKQQKFEMYMSSLLAPLHTEHSYSLSMLKKDKKDIGDKKDSRTSTSQSNLVWLNALIGRFFFDFLIEDVWAQLVTEKIQKKLNKLKQPQKQSADWMCMCIGQQIWSRNRFQLERQALTEYLARLAALSPNQPLILIMKLPFFVNELTVKDINLGSALPKIHRASDPFTDERGLWVDIDVSYNGSFHMTLETKLNLLRLKADSSDRELTESFWSSIADDSTQNDTSEPSTKSPVYNSEEEDSAESSSDEDVPLPELNTICSAEESSLPIASGSTSRKILKFVDRLAQSPYFQHAAKNKYIKKAMEDISNTPLILTVEVQWLTGTLALNIPPWPTDRLWYGFRTNPSLSIIARPKLGQRVVTLTHVTEWIEKKLVSEFQKLLVMPNMDDLIIPIMQSHADSPDTA